MSQVIITAENEHTNLCKTCNKCFADCDMDHIKFGRAIGNDNVIECDAYTSDTPVNGIMVKRVSESDE